MTQEIFLFLTTVVATLILWEPTDRVFETYGMMFDQPIYKFLAGGFVAIILGAGVADFVTFLFYGVN